jgi:uncharacterized protein (TIGR03435 family)
MLSAPRSVLRLTVVLLVTLASSRLHAQFTPPTAEPVFEVASVKANKSGAPYVGGPGDRFSDGQFRTTNIPLRLLMRQAFERPQADDVVGGPAWLDSERWDIVAKADSRTANMLPMIRSLLVERFKLTVHYETKERPIYLLTVARRDGRLGLSLRQATGSTTFLGSAGIITGRAVTMRQLANLLGSAAGRPVTDRTGLSDTYDVDLKWTPAGFAGGAGGDVARDGPDVFTAIQEQLGLKLEPSRGPVDVLVIDRVERPTDD